MDWSACGRLEHTKSRCTRRKPHEAKSGGLQQCRVFLRGALATAWAEQHVEIREPALGQSIRLSQLPFDKQERRARSHRLSAGSENADRFTIFPIVDDALQEVRIAP